MQILSKFLQKSTFMWSTFLKQMAKFQLLCIFSFPVTFLGITLYNVMWFTFIIFLFETKVLLTFVETGLVFVYEDLNLLLYANENQSINYSATVVVVVFCYINCTHFVNDLYYIPYNTLQPYIDKFSNYAVINVLMFNSI